jgi:hypothetical protein
VGKVVKLHQASSAPAGAASLVPIVSSVFSPSLCTERKTMPTPEGLHSPPGGSPEDALHLLPKEVPEDLRRDGGHRDPGKNRGTPEDPPRGGEENEKHGRPRPRMEQDVKGKACFPRGKEGPKSMTFTLAWRGSLSKSQASWMRMFPQDATGIKVFFRGWQRNTHLSDSPSCHKKNKGVSR